MDDVRAPAKRESIPLALWAIALVALSALLEWSAVVLSFLGGVRWGLETREPQPRAMRQVFSAMCAVAGWVILMARGRAPDTWILGGFITAFLIQWLFDHQTPD